MRSGSFHCLAYGSLCLSAARPLVWGEWAEIDRETAEWRILDYKMKNNKPHVASLARQVLALLENLHKYTGAGEYLSPHEVNPVS